MKNRWIILVLFTLLFVVFISLALADGDEELGPPSIDIAPANGMVAAGTGMKDWELDPLNPPEINFSIPDEATIKQVLLYWEGRMEEKGDAPEYNTPGDDTIVVNGAEVIGDPIGGPTKFCDGCSSSSFRADITNLGLVTPGDNTLTLKGLEFTFIDNGAGVLVLYQEPGPDAEIELFDGVDVAFDETPDRWPEPRKSTVPKTFKFNASTEEREAQLSMFVSSVIGERGGSERPNSIEVTTGGITEVYSDLLSNSDGEEWDTLNSDSFPEGITIPAGADSLTVQIFSRDDPPTDSTLKPASLAWITAALMVPPDEVPPEVAVSKICTPDVFVGDEIEYEITVINTGDENLTDVAVIDPLLELEVEIDSLAIGASTTVTDTMITAEAGVITNTVTVTATGEISTGEVTDTDSCTTNVYELEVTKDAPDTSLVRRYNWKCNKRANEKRNINFTLFPEQVFSPTYDVAVKLDYPPYSDSNWVVSGTISVTNPAPMDASLESVTDVISDLEWFHQYLPVISKSGESQNAGVDQNQLNHITLPGISAPVSCPSLTVPAGGTLVCTYGPVDLLSSAARTNTAFATLKNTRGGDFIGTTVFSGTAQIDLASANVELIDEEVTVTDSQEGMLGTVRAENAPKFYIYDQPMPYFSIEECSSMDKRTKQVSNTATFTTNDTKTSGSCSATVKLDCIVSASTGFEDLPLQPEGCEEDDPKTWDKCNDWDYNDAFFEVFFDDPLPTFSLDNDLKEITFQFVQPTQCSSNIHEFHIQPPFACNGTYSLTRNGDPVATNAPYQSGQDLTIFDNTGLDEDPILRCPPLEKFPPPPNTAELVINFNVPSPGACPLDVSGFDPFGTFNGEGLFYVPHLLVKVKNPDNPTDPNDDKYWYIIKPKVNPPDPRIVGVPDTWIWPNENQCIWKIYPDITPKDPDKGSPGPPLFTAFWWDNYAGPNLNKCAPWND